MCLSAVVYLSGTRRISAVLLDFHHSNCQTSAIARSIGRRAPVRQWRREAREGTHGGPAGAQR